MKKYYTIILLTVFGLVQAKQFDFSKDDLQKYISGSGDQTTLDLSYKKIKTLPTDISKKLIPVVDAKNKPIRTIDLSFNIISGTVKKGTFEGITKVEHIKITNNKISHVEPHAFDKLQSLQWVHLSHNNINKLKAETFSHLTGLWGVKLDHNKISNFGAAVLEDLRFLHEVDLSYNKIKTLETAMFAASDAERSFKVGDKKKSEISNLEIIDLSGNPLEKVEPDVFAGLPKLQQVIVSSDLSASVLKDIQKSIDMLNQSLKTRCTLIQVKKPSK